MVDIMSQEPLKLIEQSESGNIIMAYCGSLIKEKVNNLFRFFMNEEGLQE
jgi:hypothetical protein